MIFSICSQLSHDIIVQKRTGGMGSILKTFFHIIDVEQSWIRAIGGKDDVELEYDDNTTLEYIMKLSNDTKKDHVKFLEQWNVAHEIHHIGQLSVWLKEIGEQSVSVNFIGRKIMQTEESISKIRRNFKLIRKCRLEKEVYRYEPIGIRHLARKTSDYFKSSA